MFSACIGAGLLITGILYFRNRRNADAPGRVTKFIFLLRFISITAVLILLLSIVFRRETYQNADPLLILAVDNSSSMVTGSDSASVRNELPAALSGFAEGLKDRYEVRTLLFSGHSENSRNSPDFSGKETDIEGVLSDVANNFANQNVGAMILVTDGIYNRGANPLHSAAEPGFPVYCVAVGDTSEVKDLQISRVNHNEISYAGNSFPVEVIIGATRLDGAEAEVSIIENGIAKARQRVRIGSSRFSAALTFTLEAGKAGLQHYQVRITPINGETNIRNNTATFVMEVISNREKILLVAGAPHPDIAAIREVLEKKATYESDCTLLRDHSGSIKPYSLVILHGYTQAMSQIAAECTAANVPFWIINPESPDGMPGIKFPGPPGKDTDAEPALNRNFPLFSISDAFRNFVHELPAVKCFNGRQSVMGQSQVLITQKIGAVETDYPVLYFNEQNGLKTAVFAADGLWKWKMRDYSAHKDHLLFAELISKIVQYLSVKNDKSFFRVTAPRIISENEKMEFQAELYNRSYELVNDPEVKLQLSDSAGRRYDYVFSRTSDGYFLDPGMLAPGEYSYEASVIQENARLTKKGKFAVREVLAERMTTVADHRLLHQLATRTGGKVFGRKELDKLSAQLKADPSIKPVSYSQVETSPLIDLKLLFFIILLCFSLEWWLRKRYFSI
jgi:hypothetical protein